MFDCKLDFMYLLLHYCYPSAITGYVPAPVEGLCYLHHGATYCINIKFSSMLSETTTTFFAPQLLINNGVTDISFYKNAFGAIEHFCLRNDDNSVHVAEFNINGAVFHLHEVTKPYFFTPGKHNGTTTIIGLFVPNVDEVMYKAIKAGAKEISAAKDYEYAYRQAEIEDPFGHRWLIEKKLA